MFSRNNLHIFYTDIAKLFICKTDKCVSLTLIVIVVSHQLLPPHHLSTTMLSPQTGHPNIWCVPSLLRIDILWNSPILLVYSSSSKTFYYT
uniref:Uncharacterized protein n=1 Tax=Octopus bimaculoides TaxID=37653 RepID=A0A0L8HBU0_OCTBM